MHYYDFENVTNVFPTQIWVKFKKIITFEYTSIMKTYYQKNCILFTNIMSLP